MRFSIVCPLVVLAAFVVGQGVRAQETGQFLIPVSDASGSSVATLAPEDLAVFEDGKPVRVIKVEPRDPEKRPVNVTLAVDNGRAMTDVLVHVREHARAFFEALPEGVEASLVTLAPQPRFAVRNSKDRGALLKAVDRIVPDSGPGRFIEGLQDVAQHWSRGSKDTAWVLVALGSTYSEELVNKRHAEEAFGRFASTKGTVHVVMFRPVLATQGGAQHLLGQRVASQTRGRYREVGSHLQLGALSEMAQEVTNADGTGRQFLVTIERPPGATGRLGLLSLSPAPGLNPGRITRVDAR